MGQHFIRSRRLRRLAFALSEALLFASLVSCGGGSSSPPPSPGPSPSFTISVSPQNQSVDLGQSATLNLSVNAQNGFNQSINVSLTGLPSGVTSSPASSFSMTTAGQAVTLTASSSAPLGSSTITFNASSGDLKSSAQASVSVTQGPPGLANDRTSFVRTDDTPLAVVYDSVHQLVFASALHLNCVDVISRVTQHVLQCIPVPAPMGLSLSADGTQVLVGTQVGEVAWIDTQSLRVVRRDVVPQLPQVPGFIEGFNYLAPMQVYQVANGKVFLFPSFGTPAVSPIYTTPASVAEWDPSTGVTKSRPDGGTGGVISFSGDHTKIVASGGTGANAVLYDSSSDTFAQIANTANLFVAINPAGSQLVSIDNTSLIRFYNLQLQQLGSVALNSCCTPFPTVGIYSSDSRYLYVAYAPQPTGLHQLITIDATSFQVVGAAADLSNQLTHFGGSFPGIPMAADSTGLVFETGDHGVTTVDASDVRSFANPQIVNGFIVATPDEGPLNQATATQFTTGIFATLPDIFFGNQAGLNPNLNGPGQLQATAPPSGTPGPVNVKAVEANGVMALMPQGFTYGSLPIQYGLFAAGPAGGVLADLFGYGYGVDLSGANINATIGSTSATVKTKTLFPGEVPGYPFPLQHLVVSVPAGSIGPQDITVTAPTGTATYQKAFHYLKRVVDYPSADHFLYILYDPHRNNLYLSATDHIDVFSLATNSFAAPITVPSKGGTSLILGLALTPDGSKLLAANQSDQSVAIINPDNPSSGAQAVSIPPTAVSSNPGPFQIATTSTNQAFITVTTGNAVSGGQTFIYDLDLSTLQVTTANLPAGFGPNLNNNYIQGSADGTVVVEATSNSSGGPVLSWQALSGTWQLHMFEGQFLEDAAMSGDGNVLAVNSEADLSGFPFPYLLDPQLDLTAQVNFPEFQSIQEGPTLQLDQSGALLYAVNGAGVDITDTRTGQLRERILLTEQILSGPTEVLQTPSKVMATTPGGEHIFLLTTAGLTIVDLDSVPLGIGSVTPTAGPVGSTVTVRGTGFVNGTSVTVSGITAAVSFVDPSTVKVTIPATAQNGAAQFTLTNPDGTTFSLDAAFLIQ